MTKSIQEEYKEIGVTLYGCALYVKSTTSEKYIKRINKFLYNELTPARYRKDNLLEALNSEKE